MGIPRRVWDFVWPWIIKPTLLLIFGQALLRVIHEFGRYPERWMAEAILDAPSVIATTSFGWALVALFAALLLFAGERLKNLRPSILKGKQPKKPEAIDTGEKPWRIPLNTFCEYVHQNAWALYGKEGTAQFFDLINGLNQAGSDGTVEMWGKEGYQEPLFANTNLLVQLPKEYWLEHQINPFTCISSDKGVGKGIIQDNNQIRTDRRKSRIHKNIHSDIHVHRKQAEQWLKQDALAFKGKNTALIEEEFPECP